MPRKSHPGVLKEKEKRLNTIRVRAPAGEFTTGELNIISEIAERYGRGSVFLTSRLNIEIPYVPSEKVHEAVDELRKSGLLTGGTGPAVRAVFACKGTYCPHGIIDTRKAALSVEERYGGKILPVKFKAGVSGCPNNCGKAQFNDLGFIAYSTPGVLSDPLCNECGRCVRVCREDAISVTDSAVSIDHALCISCGDCISECKSGQIVSLESGVRVYIGGRAGRKVSPGILLPEDIGEDEIPVVAGVVIEYMEKNCGDHERLGAFLEKTGTAGIMEAIQMRLSSS